MHQSVATVAKDLPQLSHSREERLRQCLIMAGAENLPDSELLEVILFTSNRGKNVEPLVEKLLERFGSLAEVLNADGEALTGAGLNSSAIAGIKFIREAALRLLRSELRDRPIVNSWDKLIDYCNAQIAYSKVEEFHIFFLDRKNALIKDERQQRGTVGYTLVCTREVTGVLSISVPQRLSWCTITLPAIQLLRPRMSRPPRTFRRQRPFSTSRYMIT
jgi:DNA repair protein RadC